MKHSENLDTTRTSSIHSRWIVLICSTVFLALAFTFCGCLSKRPLNEQTFAFSTPVLPVTNAAASDRVLGIKSLQIAPPFDGRLLVYRTGEFSYERDPYAGFLGSPAKGLIGPVCGMLRGAGCFSAVVEAGSAVKPDTLVEINISQFYGDIRNPGSPCAVLAMQVMFLDATNGLPGRILLQRNYLRRMPISSTAPAALMEGWNQALAGIFAEVASDFRRQEIEGERPDNPSGNSTQK
jgi:cholesterol transport system auxiliary component